MDIRTVLTVSADVVEYGTDDLADWSVLFVWTADGCDERRDELIHMSGHVVLGVNYTHKCEFNCPKSVIDIDVLYLSEKSRP